MSLSKDKQTASAERPLTPLENRVLEFVTGRKNGVDRETILDIFEGHGIDREKCTMAIHYLDINLYIAYNHENYTFKVCEFYKKH